MLSIRRLREGDEAVLSTLARDAAEFDVEGRTQTVSELNADAASAYLGNPDVLHWVAEQDGHVDGFLLCYAQRKWHDPALEIMLYEIGVRLQSRRQGIGRALLEAMESWMRENGVEDVWVLADNREAKAFYSACGFSRDDEQPVMMSKAVR